MKAATAVCFALALGIGASAAATTVSAQTATGDAVQPAALELIKAMGDTLASADRMSFDVKGAFDVPAANGQPLFYHTMSSVTLERPDKLKVLVTGDGPPEEFTYDGAEMAVFMPASNMVARKAAPPDVDAMLREAYVTAGLYFPYVDILVSDPYASFAGHALSAFVVGQSEIVGGVTTDIVAIADGRVQWQIWIGADDKLPRLIWSTPTDMPQKPRTMVEFSNWKTGDAVDGGSFATRAPDDVVTIEFAKPTAR